MVRLSHLLAMMMIPFALLVTACGGDNTDAEADRAKAVADSIARADSLQALQDSLAQLKMMNDSLQQAAEDAATSTTTRTVSTPSKPKAQQTEKEPDRSESASVDQVSETPAEATSQGGVGVKPKSEGGTTGVKKGGAEGNLPTKTTGVKKGGGGNNGGGNN